MNPGEERLAFTVEWVMAEDGSIESQWFGRSVINSAVKLSYEHAQDMLDDPDKLWKEGELPPIKPQFNVKDIVVKVNLLNKIALNLKQKRIDNGCLKLDNPKMCFRLDPETGLPLVSYSNHQ